MNTLLSTLVDNLSELKQTCKTCNKEINYKRKNNTLIYKCLQCNKKTYKSIDLLIEKFSNVYSMCDDNIDKFLLLLRKGVYPYEYMNDFSKFKEKSLPNKESFYNKLNQENVTDNDYKHAQQVWYTFNIKNLGKYHDLYVQSDTLLLADVFENFRNMCKKEYRLDPTHFVSAPGLAWQACLKETKVKLELLIDINMLLMFEQGIHGGICQSLHRYATANNKYMKNFNKKTLSTFLVYLDANNLYGWAMCKKLPIGQFRWVKKLSSYNEQSIKNYNENSDYGAILEVDIEYLKELSSKHRDLPLLAQTKKINKTNKLVTTLEDKEKYVVHISTLKQALNHGLKLKKVHRVITFRQEAWLKPYIGMNTEVRKKW